MSQTVFDQTTSPVVEKTIAGGHAPYFRADVTPPAASQVTVQPAGGTGPQVPIPVGSDALFQAIHTTNMLLAEIRDLLMAGL